MELKKPISDELEFKASLTQDGVEINANGSIVSFVSKSDTETKILGSVVINGTSHTFQNLNDVLKNKSLIIACTPTLDNTNTADIALTIEITN